MPRTRLALATLAICALLFPLRAAQAQEGPRPDGLDQPLLAANMCGGDAPGDTQFTIAATGDLFPHENIQAFAESAGYDALFDHVRPFLQAADIGYTNFDGALLASSPFTGFPMFNFNPALAPALKNANIGLISTANNHILDRGPEGIDATLDVLARAGIATHGTVPSAAAGQPRPPFALIPVSRDGITITLGFVSASWGTNGNADPFGQVNLLYNNGSEYGQQGGGVRQSVLDAVAAARQAADVVVVAAHWGYEYQFYPDGSQVEAARQLAAAGADVILGAQPHTLQPVDIIDTDGRKTLVIYSLANFVASQGAYQAETYSATATIFYVGLLRRADGSVAVSGYRYLPTIHVDNDTRPAPIMPGDLPDVVGHVRLMMRDPGGARQVAPDPAALKGKLDVCPRLLYDAAPDAPVGGDFAQHIVTLGGGVTPRPPAEFIAVFGYPLGPVVEEPAASCAGSARVLYTERQRLEWSPGASWPFRVVGAQLGALVYAQRYGGKPEEVVRRTDLQAPDAFANDAFRAFYEGYGGLPIFGYPISGPLQEASAGGAARTVQYFERARFELNAAAPPGADLLTLVQLGLLGREYADLPPLCGARASLTSGSVQEVTEQRGPTREASAEAPAAQPRSFASLFWLVLTLSALLLLTVLAWMAFVLKLPLRVAFQPAHRPRPTARQRVANRRRALDERQTDFSEERNA
jgi:poly-gamma-glutamate capsule biosynthesis protein CapA/YwtB (metallophosphatase superfamily)